MNAREFEAAFYEAMHKWVAGGKVGPDPRGEIEHRFSPKWTWVAVNEHDIAVLGGEFRWKPAKKRTVVIDGVELVAPELVAPEDGTEIFVETADGLVVCWRWGTSDFDKRLLANGKVFLTREDCQAMADAQRKQRLGGSGKSVTDEMVTRFLGWRLPDDFAPDCYIAFDKARALSPHASWPIGTNLLHAGQAREMLEYVLGGEV